MTPRVKCRDCLAWKRDGQTPHGGECRRHAPSTLDSEWYGVWPKVAGTDWCLQGVPKDSEVVA